MKTNMHDGHRARLREKIEKFGIRVLADHEKLEYLLYPFVPRRDTNPIAHELIETFGSLNGVLDASVDELSKIKGVSKNAALFLHTLPELYVYSAEAPKLILHNAEDASAYAIRRIGKLPTERFVCLFLGDKGKVLRICDLAEGSGNAVAVNREELVRLAIQCDAKIVILAHNHPSGDLYPSNADILSTNTLAQSLFFFGIRLWDHIIVSATDSFSMLNHGLIESSEEFKKKPLPFERIVKGSI